ncbi:MAG: OmpH family outer membrane protein [Chitinophagales bacterium]|jgi:outer membrane protein|nr:OmpH family outer membrane protein [Chitinophagales bacterium]
MKNLFLTSLLSLFILGNLQAQKVALIESEYILGKMPNYEKNKLTIEKITAEWQTEIQNKMDELENELKIFQAENALYSDKEKLKKSAAIEAMQKDIANLQRQRFGINGDLFKKRQELVQPMLDQITSEATKIAQSKGYDLVLDKSNGNSVIFFNPKINISDDILKALGF